MIVPNKQINGVIYNEGVAVLSALARQRGWETELVRTDLTDIRSGAFAPDRDAAVHALSYASGQHVLAGQVARAIRAACPRAVIIVGGIHATVAREEVLALPEADAVVSGEGERAFCALLESGLEGLRRAGLPNVWVRGDEVRPLSRADFVDVNALPFPDRAIFDRAALAKSPEFIFSRGCPHSCAYCANAFLNGVFGCKIRRKSPQRAMDEIADARAVLGFGPETLLTFHDDIFLTDTAWLREFAALYAERFGNPFRCNTTAKAVNEENVRLLRDMGCRELWIGIETGNERIRREVLRKNVSNETILRAFRLANAAGLRTVSFMMVGIPGEDWDSLRDSMRLNRACGVYSTSISRFQPLPGTPIYEQALRRDALRQLSEEQKDLGLALFGLKEDRLKYHELNYAAILAYHYSKGNAVQAWYMRLFRKPLNTRAVWEPFWRLLGVLDRLFPERHRVVFERRTGRS
jgi:radical SAM superfamily enzyme YgiQ (UPF0313 family)